METKRIQQLLFLYSLQYSDEQTSRSTRYSNNQGFNRTDAPLLTSYATRLLDGHELTPAQFEILEDRLRKYHKQLKTMPEDFDYFRVIDEYDSTDLMVLSAPDLFDNTMKTYYDVYYFGFDYRGPEPPANPYARRGNVSSKSIPCRIE